MQGRNLTDAAPREEPGTPRTLKTPPHSAEAEQAVLGGLMLNNEAWDDVADRIASRDFYWPKHRFIFEAMALLAGENQPLDALTLSDALQSRGQLDRAGGPAYLGELAESTPGASNVPAYARIVQERSTLRQLIGAAQGMGRRRLSAGWANRRAAARCRDAAVAGHRRRPHARRRPAVHQALGGPGAGPSESAVREQECHHRAGHRL